MMLESSAIEQQRIAELRPAGERGRPVAGVHIADGDEIAGARGRRSASSTKARSVAS